MAEEYKAVTINIKTAEHEQLDGIMGGDDDGHFHLTLEEYDLMQGMLGDYQDELDDGGLFLKLHESEYEKLSEILDMLYPDEDTEIENTVAEIINSQTDNYLAEHNIIDGGELV